jgi:cysteinyl-tRNA synthetase
MNITDVGHLVSDADTGEDKMLKGARERQMSPWQIAEEYTKIFMEDAASLNIEKPEFITKATDHIPQMLKIIEALYNNGYAYELSDGVYFDIGQFSEYGRLSRLDLDEQLAGARIEINTEKRHPADFALWIKAPEEHIMQWESPWGMGYPGWHIECSAMSVEYLGDKIDIHTGGVDHIPIHHENEIAQSDAYIGRRVVNIWMHGEFLLIDGGRMSKSLKNNYIVADLRAKGINPLVYRYFCLNGHYRNKLNFTWDALHAASVSYRRFIDGALAHRDAAPPGDAVPPESAGDAGIPDGQYITSVIREFETAINDDLNIPKALGIAWQAIRNPIKSHAIYEMLIKMDEIFGFGINKYAAEKTSGSETKSACSGAPGNENIPPEVPELLALRNEARAAKNWAKADELRGKIKDMGYNVIDSKEGSIVELIVE